LGHKHRQTIHKKQKLLSFYPIIFFRSSVQLPHLLDYGNNPLLQDKKDLFESFQFAIIIENSKQQHYFTEKLIDCLLMKTIPIYWGCPNISDYFDTTGWILLDNTNNIIQELKMKLFIIMTSNYYNEHLHTINHNYSTAIYYSDLYKNINMSSLTK